MPLPKYAIRSVCCQSHMRRKFSRFVSAVRHPRVKTAGKNSLRHRVPSSALTVPDDGDPLILRPHVLGRRCVDHVSASLIKVRCAKEPSRCSGSLPSSTEPARPLASAALGAPRRSRCAPWPLLPTRAASRQAAPGTRAAKRPAPPFHKEEDLFFLLFFSRPG